MTVLKKISIAFLFLVLAKEVYSVVFPSSQEVLIANRIEYLNHLRKFAGDLFWKDFSNDSSVGTIVYFTASASYFFHPDPVVMEKTENKFEIVASPTPTKMLRLKNPFDSAVNVMETEFEYEDYAKNKIDYKNPVLFCTSTEDIATYDPKINSTEDWVIIALHQYYHQFQYKHDAVFNYILSLTKQNRILNMDTLQGIFRSNWAFHDTLLLENQNLLNALNSTSMEQEKAYYKEFLRLRDKRRAEYNKKYKFQIGIPEDFWEKMEGTAQYLEAATKMHFADFPVDSVLVETDPMYKSNNIFQDFSFDTAPEYYDSKDAIYYLGATGFNLVRLLEKNKVDYKDNFFNYASLPLHLQLKYFYKL